MKPHETKEPQPLSADQLQAIRERQALAMNRDSSPAVALHSVVDILTQDVPALLAEVDRLSKPKYQVLYQEVSRIAHKQRKQLQQARAEIDRLRAQLAAAQATVGALRGQVKRELSGLLEECQPDPAPHPDGIDSYVFREGINHDRRLQGKLLLQAAARLGLELSLPNPGPARAEPQPECPEQPYCATCKRLVDE